MTPVNKNILTPSEAGSGPKGLAEATTIIHRTYEHPYKWYYVVFKPYNSSYEKDPDWYKVKGLGSCRRSFKTPKAIIMTREIVASKVHINVLVCTSSDVILRHEKDYNNKYKLHVSLLLTQADRQNVLTYLWKEALNREFVRYLDYITFPNNIVPLGEDTSSTIIRDQRRQRQGPCNISKLQRIYSEFAFL